MGYSIVLLVYSASNDDQSKGLLSTKDNSTNHTKCGRKEPPMFCMIPSKLIGKKKLQQYTLDADMSAKFQTGVAELHAQDKSNTNGLSKAFVCVPMNVLEKSSHNKKLTIPFVSDSKIISKIKKVLYIY